jgi:hypothetical protein
MSEPIVMYDSPEAAQPATLTLADGTTRQLWVGGGHAYSDEDMARYAGCTHRPCKHCSAVTEKSWTACDPCRAKKDRERWEALPAKPWDGDSPVCIWRDDRYFWSLDEFEDWAEDEGIDKSKVMLVHCEPQYAPKISEDFACDVLPEDHEGDLPAEIQSAVEAFNAAIKAYGKPLSWVPGDERVEMAK